METLEHSDKPKSQDNERLSQTKLVCEWTSVAYKSLFRKVKERYRFKTNWDSRKILTIEALKANNHWEDIYGKWSVTKSKC